MNINDLNVSTYSFDGEEFSMNYASELQSKRCSILTYGLIETEGDYYICDCDPERNNPICEYCFMACHNNDVNVNVNTNVNGVVMHKLIHKERMKAVCVCGFNSHKPMSSYQDNNVITGDNNVTLTSSSSSLSVCLFGELSMISGLNYMYQSLEDSNTYICFICYNICHKMNKNLIRKSIVEYKGFKCTCKHRNHSEIKVMYRKLRSLAKTKHYLKKYDFNGITFINLINIILGNHHIFTSLFHSFISLIQSTYANITINNLDKHNTINMLHLTCHVLFAFAEKVINSTEYKIKNTLNNIPPHPELLKQLQLQSHNMNDNVLSHIERKNVYVRCKSLYYVNNVIADVLSCDVYFAIMQCEFDYKSRNIWQLKYFLTCVFYVFNFKKDFVGVPMLKVNDVVMLSPFQRLMMLGNVVYESKLYTYTKNLNYSYVNAVLRSIEMMIMCKERNVTVLLILGKLYKMCLMLVKVGLFNYEQVNKFCMLNETLIASFTEDTNNNSINSSNSSNTDMSALQHDKNLFRVKILSSMIKAIMFITIYYNDQIILNAYRHSNNSSNSSNSTSLNNKTKRSTGMNSDTSCSSSSSYNFFHSKNDYTRLFTQNTILILTYMNNTFSVDDITKQRETERNVKSKQPKKVPSTIHELQCIKSSFTVKMKKILPEKRRYAKCMHNIIKHSLTMISLLTHLNEVYSCGMIRIISGNSYMAKMYEVIEGNVTSKEKEFVNKCRYLSNEVEAYYMEFFKDVNSCDKERELTQKIEDILNEYVNDYDKLTNRNKRCYKDNEKQQQQQQHEEQLLLNDNNDIHSTLNDYDKNNNNNGGLLSSNESSLSYTNDTHHNNNNSNSNNTVLSSMLVTKTFFLQTVYKYINVLYYHHLSKKLPQSDFTIKPSLLKKTFELTYTFLLSNVDNCIFFLQSDFLSNLSLLNNTQLIYALTLIHLALSTISSSNSILSSHTTILPFINAVLLKTTTYDLLNHFLKVYVTLCSIAFINEHSFLKKTRTTCKLLYKYHTAIKTYITVMTSDNNDNNIQTTKHHIEKIVKKFLIIINFAFSARSVVVNEMLFLEGILTKTQIMKLLYHKTINIRLRKELIEFMCNVYMNAVLDMNDVNYYKSILMNAFTQSKKEEEGMELDKQTKFDGFVIKSSVNYNVKDVEVEGNVVKYELLNFQEVLINVTQRNKIKMYVESVIMCFMMYVEKFSAIVYDMNGFNYLSLYEMIYYFLQMKKYVYNRADVFDSGNDSCNKKKYNEFIMNDLFLVHMITYVNAMTHSQLEFTLERSENNNNKVETYKETKYEAKTLFNPKHKRTTSSSHKTSSSLHLTDEDKIYHDIATMNDEHFQYLDITTLKRIYTSHIEHFIKTKPLYNYKSFFAKKETLYNTEHSLSSLKQSLQHNNNFIWNLNTFNATSLSIVTAYYDMKHQLQRNNTLIPALNEINTHFNTSYRLLLCKALLYSLNVCNSKHNTDVLWMILRLLQYDTVNMQETFTELSDNSSKTVFDFNDIVNQFTKNVIGVFISKINKYSVVNVNEYFKTVMNVKIMKYFCEEHNTRYQSMFYNNTDISESKVIVLYKRRIKHKRKPTNKTLSSEFNIRTPKTVKQIWNVKRNSKTSQYSKVSGNIFGNTGVYVRKASVFEFMLCVLQKVIYAFKRSEDVARYYYDVFFVVLEFLIEMIQGTTSDNLMKVFDNNNRNNGDRSDRDDNGNSNSSSNKHKLFNTFLIEMNKLLIDDSNDNDIYYTIRKDIADFIMAFLEENATPPVAIVTISSILLPSTILDSIISTMHKLYNTSLSIHNNNCNTNNINTNILLSQHKRVFTFTPEMLHHFTKLYFTSSSSFIQTSQRFAFANRLYQYFKMLSKNRKHIHPFVNEFYSKYEMFTETEVIKAYYNNNNDNNKLINKITHVEITDNKFIDQYLCVKFFESITRNVFIQKEYNDKPISVIFTVNPLVFLLSKISKDDFINNVNRTNRYTKLFCLMERCDNFYEEICYRQQHGNTNCIRNIIDRINFYYMELISFMITVIINLIMIVILKGEGDVLYGDDKINFVLIYLGIINAVFNVLVIVLWLISRFNLLYMTEKRKMIKTRQRQLRNDNDDSVNSSISIGISNTHYNDESLLTCKDKLKAVFIVLISKHQINGFIWNVIFSSIASSTEIYFIYICQLFIIFNLSSTLRNLIYSLLYKAKQLGATFYFSVIVNLCLAYIAFLYFEEDFTKIIDSKMPHYYPHEFTYLNDIIGSPFNEPAHIESECATLAYCFATHLDYGMRFDGGIADRMNKRSYNVNKGIYLARFFYEMVYFISQTVLLQGMLFNIVIEAFGELRNKEMMVERDKKEICYICGIDKVSCEKNGKKFEEHVNVDHNIWTYVEYILGLKFVDVQETNAINSYVVEKIEEKSLSWFPRNNE